MARIVVAEVCPQCGSLDARASESTWFRIEWERRDDLDDGLVDRVEFECRDCGLRWD
jgi:predicted RNA-binding Zn-ribbon protein involved in translation (DUF1610 family)